MDQLQALFTKKQTIEYNGVQIQLSEISIGDLPLIIPIIESFIKTEGETQDKIMNLVKENHKDIITLIARLTGLSDHQASSLSIDATVFIVAKIISLNIVFLKKNVVPMATDLAKQMQTEIGSTQSKS